MYNVHTHHTLPNSEKNHGQACFNATPKPVECRPGTSVMRLLVSVGNAAEAVAAVRGGADLVDAKDPSVGALGSVPVNTLREIHMAVGGERPVTAALGDASDETAIETVANTFASTGAAFVKVGFAGIDNARRVRRLADAATRGARNAGKGTAVVVVAYADAHRVEALSPPSLAEVAAAAGVDGLLIDTADKHGPGLRGLVGSRTLTAWVAEAHKAGLFAALAGKLTSDDMGFVRDTGADIAGVRGAACESGRTGKIAVNRVRLLREQCAAGLAARSIS